MSTNSQVIKFLNDAKSFLKMSHDSDGKLNSGRNSLIDKLPQLSLGVTEKDKIRGFLNQKTTDSLPDSSQALMFVEDLLGRLESTSDSTAVTTIPNSTPTSALIPETPEPQPKIKRLDTKEAIKQVRESRIKEDRSILEKILARIEESEDSTQRRNTEQIRILFDKLD